MKKTVIRLTENDVRRMVAECAQRILAEGEIWDNVKNQAERGFGHLKVSAKKFLDPTSALEKPYLLGDVPEEDYKHSEEVDKAQDEKYRKMHDKVERNYRDKKAKIKAKYSEE